MKFLLFLIIDTYRQKKLYKKRTQVDNYNHNFDNNFSCKLADLLDNFFKNEKQRKKQIMDYLY